MAAATVTVLEGRVRQSRAVTAVRYVQGTGRCTVSITRYTKTEEGSAAVMLYAH